MTRPTPHRARPPRRFATASLLSSLCVLAGCAGKTVDLGANGNPAGSAPVYSGSITAGSGDASTRGADPFRVVDAEVDPCVGAGGFAGLGLTGSFGVHAGRLYWVSLAPLGTGEALPYYLRSCDVNDCAGSIISSALIQPTYTGNACGGADRASGVQFDDEFVYWTDSAGFPTLRARTVPNAAGEAMDAQTAFRSFLIDQGMLYFATTESQVLACDASNCSASLRRLQIKAPDGGDSFQPGELVGRDADYLYFASPTNGSVWNLIRARKDESQPLEVLLTTPVKPGGVQLQGDYLYWFEDVSFGRVLRCPKSGCLGSPTILAEGFIHPNGLVVDDTALYVLERPWTTWHAVAGHDEAVIERPGRILTCAITGCSNPTVFYTASEDSDLQRLVMDERFVYLAGSSCTTTSRDAFGNLPRCHHITAIPR